MDSTDYNNDFERWGVPAIESMMNNDPKLRDFEKDIRRRYAIYEKARTAIDSSEGMDNFSRSYKDFGVNVLPDNAVICREWAPNAKAMFLKGEFNNWEEWGYEAKAYGKWEMYIPPNHDGTCRIHHLSELKIVIETKSEGKHEEQRIERVSPWARYLVEEDNSSSRKWRMWNPPRSEVCLPTNRRPPKPERLRIYEAHIGSASVRPQIATYRQFAREVLPRIRELGYNCVLLLAVMEHPQYASFGERVANFFAVSSRFGSPEDLKMLINIAHGMGITVMMDVHHNEASNMAKTGLSMFDGSADGYFHEGRRGTRERSQTRLFNYTKWEVLRFLMSNLRYFMDEFNFDGFRFNRVDSMIYHDRSEGRRWSDDYRQYFGTHIDLESIAYLTLANDMLHSSFPNVLTIAQQESEMPGMCRSIREGGFGFDYKLGTSVPNKWVKLLDESRDEDWNMGFIFHAMTQKRKGEKTVAMAESRIQSMAGQQTLVSKLMGNELCHNMSESKPITPGVERGMALHKMIRLMTHSLSGESYMTFMGNEFGHPDQLELPSERNSWSLEFSRRRYELCDDQQLRYKFLARFEKALNELEQQHGWLCSAPGYVSRKHEGDKVFVFERADLLFLFNFHPTKSYPGYRVGVDKAGTYKIVLDSDNSYFGGYGRIESSVDFNTESGSFDNRNNSVQVYLPSRTALVMVNKCIAVRPFRVCDQYDPNPFSNTSDYGWKGPGQW